MADSVQLDILKRLTTFLEGISTDSGDDFDLAGKVFRGRLLFGDADPDIAVSIVEHVAGEIHVSVAGENGIDQESTWILLLQGWMKIRGDHPTDDLYQLKATVTKRMSRCIQVDPATGDPMYPDDYFLGLTDTITGMAIGPGVVSISLKPESSSRAFFYLPVGIGLALNISEPFVA